tara:strand:+ start:444 stop:581 length:138 start_codon:yes stop_codon:yes gene_type:complete
MTATYIDLVQTVGIIMIFAVAAYAIKQMLVKSEHRIEEVDVRIEK